MTKLSGRYVGIYFAGYELSGWSRQFDATIEFDELDGTAFLDGCKNSFPGLEGGSANVEAFLSTGAADSQAALRTYPGSYTNYHLLIMIGQNATPAIGDPVFMLTSKQFDYKTPLSVAAAVVIQTMFKSQTKPVWGSVLANTTITNTTTFTSIVNCQATAQSSDGAEAILEVITPASADSYVVDVQDAPDDSTYVDLITFSANGQSRTSERGTVTGAVDKDVRAIATRTGSAGDSFKLAVGFKRL